MLIEYRSSTVSVVFRTVAVLVWLKTDRPYSSKEREMEKGSGRHPTIRGREQSVFNQANICTVSRATLGTLLRDGAKRVWAFPSLVMSS